MQRHSVDLWWFVQTCIGALCLGHRPFSPSLWHGSWLVQWCRPNDIVEIWKWAKCSDFRPTFSVQVVLVMSMKSGKKVDWWNNKSTQLSSSESMKQSETPGSNERLLEKRPTPAARLARAVRKKLFPQSANGSFTFAGLHDGKSISRYKEKQLLGLMPLLHASLWSIGSSRCTNSREERISICRIGQCCTTYVPQPKRQVRCTVCKAQKGSGWSPATIQSVLAFFAKELACWSLKSLFSTSWASEPFYPSSYTYALTYYYSCNAPSIRPGSIRCQCPLCTRRTGSLLLEIWNQASRGSIVLKMALLTFTPKIFFFTSAFS